MYGKLSNSWLKHWDFVALDLIGLQIAYVLAYLVRNQWQNPYADALYLNMGIIIALADIATAFFTEGYRGILRRGYFQEFKAVFRHMAWIVLIQILYLFLSKQGEEFSRMTFVVYVLFAVVLLYGERILWKRFLKSKSRLLYTKNSILLIVDSSRAERVVSTVLDHTYNEIEVSGIVIVDRDDLVGSEISGLKVVSTMKDTLDYTDQMGGWSVGGSKKRYSSSQGVYSAMCGDGCHCTCGISYGE